MARMTGKETSGTGRSGSAGRWGISPETRHRTIGEVAYSRYVQRGYTHGHELEDWFAAEAQFERLGRRQHPREPDVFEEVGMQHGGTLGPAQDEALKRILKQHPRRDIPRVESIEPEDAPLKE